MTDSRQITDNQEASRFELRVDGHLAELRYRRRGDRLVLTHTGVPPELEGQGIAGGLVTAAVDRAARENLTVVPLCPFAHRWLARHPGVAAGVAIDWGPEGPGDPATRRARVTRAAVARPAVTAGPPDRVAGAGRLVMAPEGRPFRHSHAISPNGKGAIRMSDFGELDDKAKQAAGEHPEQVDQGLDKAEEFADQKTGGRFDSQIQEGEQRAEGYLGTGGQGGQGGQGEQGEQGGGQNQ